MDAVGDQHGLAWYLSGAELVWENAELSETYRALERRSDERGGVELTWSDMENIAAECHQVIDGRFTGFDGDQPVLALAAIDSSYWTVWAADPAVLAQVSGSFENVEDYDEPTPAR